MSMLRAHWPVFFCAAFLAVAWIHQGMGTYQLMFDETQYWFWGKHLAWGYYSKPPMIAWLMGLSTALFGDGIFGVKMLSPVLLLLTGLLLYATARRLDYAKPIARWVLVTYLTLPIVTGNAMFFSTDVPLQCAWAFALYAVISALKLPQRRVWWLVAGMAAGLGLLSKYTMVGFAASTLLALVLNPSYRPQLRSIFPWAAATVAAVIFLPNLLWNAQHHFVTFSHTNDNVFSKQVEIYPADMLEFIAGQLLIFGPILLVALILSLRGVKRESAPALLHCYVWPLAFAGIVVSLLAGAQAHWIAPSYLAATLIVVPWLYTRAPRWLTRSLLLHLVVMALFYAAPGLMPHLPLKRDPLARLFVWNQLAQEIRPTIAAYPDAILLSDERKIAAALTYGLRDMRGVEQPVYKWNPTGAVRDHYDLLTQQQADLRGHDLLVVTRQPVLSQVNRQPGVRIMGERHLQGYRFLIYFIPAFGGY
jgi:4-amino-4-deoxy-L-arabinose transferase-like glycosyltransferase